MGSDWSWPCGERGKVKYKAQVFKTQSFSRPEIVQQIKICSFQVVSIATIFLNRELKRSSLGYHPLSISNHPHIKEESLIVYRKTNNIQSHKDTSGYGYVSSFSFIGVHLDSWQEMLSIDLHNSIETNQLFLGIVGSSGNYYLGFFKPNSLPIQMQSSESTNLSVLTIDDINKTLLESFLNSQPQEFKGFITHKNTNLIILQSNLLGRHFVFEFSRAFYENNTLETTLAEFIEEKCEKNLDFKGLLTCKGTLYLIFFLRN